MEWKDLIGKTIVDVDVIKDISGDIFDITFIEGDSLTIYTGNDRTSIDYFIDNDTLGISTELK